jgi:enterochelin esterase-like enzyme
LDERGVEHLWQANPGGHNWQYWTQHVVDYLQFYGNALTPR